ncbi:MAG: hypothetical protein HY294_14005 [Candidatus Rokubacteria bacterium]|nr:hypothetical protein [Candidatus Rokubacteria bacterium]MBI3827103.1 hypothetical protein [Candidatus Rokubacteria bacterium]
MRHGMLLSIALLLVTASAAPGTEPIVIPPGYLRVEAQPATTRAGRPIVEGYVHNLRGHGVIRLRLAIEQLDAAGQVVGSEPFWIPGELAPFDRAYFSASVPVAGATYRVLIVSATWVKGGGA